MASTASSSSLLRDKLMMAKAPPGGSAPPAEGGDAPASPAGGDSSSPMLTASSSSVSTAAGSKLMERMRLAGVPPPGGAAPPLSPSTEDASTASSAMAAAAASPTSAAASAAPSPSPLQRAPSSLLMRLGAAVPPPSAASAASTPPPTVPGSLDPSPPVSPTSSSDVPTMRPGSVEDSSPRSSPLFRKLVGSMAPPPSASTAAIANSEPAAATASASAASAGGSPRPSLPRFVPLNRAISVTTGLRTTAGLAMESSDAPGLDAGGTSPAVTNSPLVAPAASPLASFSGTGSPVSIRRSGSDPDSTGGAASPAATGSSEGSPTLDSAVAMAVASSSVTDEMSLFRRASRGDQGASADTIRLSHGRRIGQRPVSMYGGVIDREDSLSELLKEAGDQYGKAFALACKKFSTANKQLIVVAKHATEPAASPQNAKKKDKRKDSMALTLLNLGTQLREAKTMLETANAALDVDLRGLSATFDDASVSKVVVALGTTAKATTFLINSCKAMVLEKTDVDLYKQVLTATRTIRDAIALCAETLAQAPMYLQNATVKNQVEGAVRTVKQSLAQLVMTQAQQTGERLVSGQRRCELLAAIAASVASCAKLLVLRSSNEDEAVVEMVTVCATSISQLATCLVDCANSDVMLTQPQYQDLIATEWCRQLKDAFVTLVEETRNLLGSALEDESSDSSPAFVGLLALIARVHASIEHMSTLEASKLLADMDPQEPSEALMQAAEKAVRALVPKAPPKPPAAAAEQPRESKDVNAVNIWEEPSDNPENIIFSSDLRLRAATLNKIVERLTMADPPVDITNLVKTFVTTYRSMATPGEVLKRLIERWEVPAERESESVPIRLRVVNLLRAWLEANFKDFATADIARLRDFVDSKLMNSPSHAKFGVLISEFLKKKLTSHVDDVKQTLVELKLDPKIPLSPSKFITVFDEMEIAKQLTLVEFSIYRSIQPVELLSQSWNVEKLKYRAKNVRALIQRSTALSMYVASCVLWQPTLKDRARVLTRIIRIAEHLRRFNNFNSLMAIISGLNLSSVRRLKHTWSELNANDVKSFESLEQVMSSDSAFSVYRNSIKSINPPCVPFLGVYLTDLTFSDDGNPDFVNGLINFSKREQIYTVIQELLQYQNTPYISVTYPNGQQVKFEYVDHIAAFLKELPQNNDNDLYKLSTTVEPKNSDKSTIL